MADYHSEWRTCLAPSQWGRSHSSRWRTSLEEYTRNLQLKGVKYTRPSSACPDGRGPCIFTSIQMDSPLYLGRLNMDMDGWLSVCSFNKTGKLSIAKVHKGRAGWINSKGMNNRVLPKWPAGLKEKATLARKINELVEISFWRVNLIDVPNFNRVQG